MDVPQEALLAADNPHFGLKVRQAAAQAGVSEGTIRAWINAGKLPAYKLGRQLRVKTADLARMLEARP